MSISGFPRVTRALQRRAPGRLTLRGTEDVQIGELVSPLRYDVMVRARLFDRLAVQPDLKEVEVHALRDEPEVREYRQWFEAVAMHRFHPEILRDPVRLEHAFDERVTSAARLLLSFRQHGFDPAHPIVLRVASRRTTYPCGKPVHRSRHMGDGCHRLALLLSAGWGVVPAHLYRIDPVPLRTVPDNTARLLRRLAVSDADYARFLSLGYADTTYTDIPALLEDVALRRPQRLTELRSVLAADGREAAAR